MENDSGASFDRKKADAFAGYALGVMNGGFLTLMISVGHRTRLFDAMATLPPATSHEIAEKTGLKERYVREWLGSMVTGKIVEYDSGTKNYRFPPEHAAMMTRKAGIDNLASSAQFLSMMGEVEGQVVDCFRKGGGVPYSEYPRFAGLMMAQSSQVHNARLIDTILPLVSGLPDRMTEGIKVLDVGCGSGHAINLMGKAFPNSKFVGYDFSKQGIAKAKEEARKWKLSNTRFIKKDVATIDEVKKYDFITAFDSIHDQAKPTKVLKAISRALKPDGAFLMVD